MIDLVKPQSYYILATMLLIIDQIWIPDGSGNFRNRFGSTTSDFSAWDLTTNFELANVNNALFKMNSIHGGVIVPRGTSLVGMDLRKTKIRPKFVPNPLNDNVERSAIFRVTGA